MDWHFSILRVWRSAADACSVVEVVNFVVAVPRERARFHNERSVLEMMRPLICREMGVVVRGNKSVVVD
jgi:hypothetical protein